MMDGNIINDWLVLFSVLEVPCSNIGLKPDYLLLSRGFSQFFEANSVIVLSRVVVTIDGVLDWVMKFSAPYTVTPLGTTDNTALSLFYTLSVHR
jgi:hypothetical protein